MRWLITIVVLLLASRASAETRCYAGTQTDDKPQKIVLQVDLDATKHEIREHEWTQAKPTEHVTLLRVAADGKTIAWGNERFAGTGTVFGKPGKWTGYHRETEKYGAIITIDTKLTAGALTYAVRASHDGKLVQSVDVDAKAFDCKGLTAQRAALDGIAADAKHVCFDGISELMSKYKDRVLIDQALEPSRIVLITIGAHGENHMILDIDGSKATVHDPSFTSSYTGTGTVEGKPGAWTSYAYKLTFSDPTLTLAATGTLGGAHYTGRIATGDSHADAHVEADAFDCSDLEKRRATLK